MKGSSPSQIRENDLIHLETLYDISYFTSPSTRTRQTPIRNFSRPSKTRTREYLGSTIRHSFRQIWHSPFLRCIFDFVGPTVVVEGKYTYSSRNYKVKVDLSRNTPKHYYGTLRAYLVGTTRDRFILDLFCIPPKQNSMIRNPSKQYVVIHWLCRYNTYSLTPSLSDSLNRYQSSILHSVGSKFGSW